MARVIWRQLTSWLVTVGPSAGLATLTWWLTQEQWFVLFALAFLVGQITSYTLKRESPAWLGSKPEAYEREAVLVFAGVLCLALLMSFTTGTNTGVLIIMTVAEMVLFTIAWAFFAIEHWMESTKPSR